MAEHAKDVYGLTNMPVGGNKKFPNGDRLRACLRSAASYTGKKLGRTYTVRVIDNEIHVWRIK